MSSNPQATRRHLLFALTIGAKRGAAAESGETTLIRNARIFDGNTVFAGGSVLVREGTTAAVGRKVQAPNHVGVVDGRGKTLMPELIDAHTHTLKRESLVEALRFGVTTQIDLGTPSIQFARAMSEEQLDGRARDRAHLLSAGRVVTVAGGHGSQEFTLNGAQYADQFIADRIAEGSEFIKLILEDRQGRIPTFDEITFKAAVHAATRRGKLAVVHVKTTEHARWAAEAGASGLAHGYHLGTPDAQLPNLLRERRLFVIPTLTVYEAVWDLPGRFDLIQDIRITNFLDSGPLSQMNRQLSDRPSRDVAEEHHRIATANILALFRAGVPILAGSDVPNPGTLYGASLHRELELLTRAGLPPIEVLRSVTSVPARCFRLDGRGVIAEGARADLVLVNGNPDADITSTRDIVAVWKEGRKVNRTATSP
jgi:imidazolonepropionase-like amidohydrolase